MTLTLDKSTHYEQAMHRIGCSPGWLESLRDAAFRAFTDAGYPTRKNEEWRFTPISQIVETPFVPSVGSHCSCSAEVAALSLGDLGGDLLVFVDGVFCESLSTAGGDSGARVGSLAELLSEEPEAIEGKLGALAQIANAAFAALNTALFTDGAYVLIPRNITLSAPIQILHLSSGPAAPTASFPRTLIVAQSGAQAQVVECFASSSSDVYFTNAVTEIVVGESACVEHVKVTREGSKGQHIWTAQVEIERSGRFRSHNVSQGGALVRNDINLRLAGEGIDCILNGLTLAQGSQIVDNHTFVDHASANCASHELYKAILTDEARGVFNGKIMVRPDAQKTDAKQTNKTLLLSGEARIDTKPQLEIFADDVKCTHGATVGQADEEAIFYLRTRGIGEEDARSLMTYAFASDIISRIPIEAVREILDRLLFTQGALQGVR